MPNYVELLRRIAKRRTDAGSKFHTPESEAKISDAVAGHAMPLDEVSEHVKRQQGGHHSKSEFMTAVRDPLRAIDVQLTVLEAAVQSAARADAIKVRQIVVDRHVAQKKAEVQQAADAELVKQIRKLISQVRDDVRDAGRTQPDDGGSEGSPLGPIDLSAFKEALDKRAAHKEDKILAKQLALISGLASRD